MKRRPAARVILLNDQNEVLLFRFSFPDGALAGQSFWATVGGAVEQGETFAQAAVRELREETGISVADIGTALHHSEFPLTLVDGSLVMAEEVFFGLRSAKADLSQKEWSDFERKYMVDQRWWSVEQIKATGEKVYPENLCNLMGKVQ